MKLLDDFSVKNYCVSWHGWFIRQKLAFGLLKEFLYSNETTDRGEPLPRIVRWNKILWQQKQTQLPILNICFAKENKTKTQQTKYLVMGILSWTPQARNRLLSVFVEIFVWCARFSFVGLNRTRSFHFFSATWVRYITTFGRACWM